MKINTKYIFWSCIKHNIFYNIEILPEILILVWYLIIIIINNSEKSFSSGILFQNQSFLIWKYFLIRFEKCVTVWIFLEENHKCAYLTVERLIETFVFGGCEVCKILFTAT